MGRAIRWRRVLLGALLLALALPQGVGAHANYERSDPPANAILERAPEQMRVWFGEEAEPRFSELQVFDTSRRRVDRNNLALVPGEPRALQIGLADLPPGTYTVVWKTLSAVDGHVTRGAFPCTVGLDQVPAPLLIPQGADGASGYATPWSVLSRWLNVLTIVLVAGAFVALPLVLGGALRVLGAEGDAGRAATAWGVGRRRGLLVAAVAGAGGGLAAGVLALLVQASVAAGVEPWEVFGPPLATLLGTRYSQIWLGRMVLLVTLGALALYLRRPGVTARHRGWWLGSALGALLLLTNSLNSHAAAAQQWTIVAVAADWLHLAATAVWIGGLVQLAAALPPALGALAGGQQARLLGAAIPRFSVLAAVSVAVLVITGLYHTWLQVGSWDALTTTAYGQALAVKVLVLLPLLALGAVNLFVVSPGVARAVRRGAQAVGERLARLERGFRLAVRAEVLFGVLILAIVGLLTSIEPARDALRQQGIVQSFQAGDVRVVLRAAPGEAGLNTFDAALTVNGQPIADAQRVTLRVTHTEMDMGTNEQRLEPTGDGHYRAVSGALSMAGRWDVQAFVRRAGQEDAQGDLRLTILDAGGGRAASGAPASGAGEPPTRLFVGSALVVLGVIFLVDAIRPVRRRRPAATVLLGCLALTAGLALATIAALVPQASELNIPNPVPLSQASVDRGEQLYQQNCVVCHGLSGRGDGPLAATLNPRPADLRTHVAQHTEGQLWWWVTEGMPGTAMPPFKTNLSDEDRWHVINYLRSRYGPAPVASQR